MDSRLDERRFEVLLEVGRTLVSQLKVEEILDRVLHAARELTGARYAALGILDDQRRELDRFLTVGIDPETQAAIGDLPRGRGILGELIRNPKPLRLSNVGDHPRSYGFPPGHPPMSSFLGVPVVIRGEAYGNLYLTEKEGGDFDEQDEHAVVVLADWAAIAIENARLYERAEGRRAELERAVGGLEATTAIARAVGGEIDLDRILELITKRGRALIEARSLLIMLEEAGELVVEAGAGEAGAEAMGRRVSSEGTLPGQVLRSKRPERLADVSSTLRHSLGDLDTDATTAMLVPLIFREQALGVLVALDRLAPDPSFGDEEERLLLSFAASAATAVATAKSVAEERLRETILAAEHERRRWARELHDETLQSLGGLSVALSSALQRESAEGLEAAVRKALEHTSLAIENLRGLITELRPALLDELGLEPALESLAERTASVEGLQVATDVRLGGSRLAPELESTVYRLVQEALTNVAKHAEANRVDVSIEASGPEIAVVVSDDGRGFEASHVRDGFGLTGMQERVELAGGRLEIDSAPGAGTTVRASITASPVTGDQQRRRRAAS